MRGKASGIVAYRADAGHYAISFYDAEQNPVPPVFAVGTLESDRLDDPQVVVKILNELEAATGLPWRFLPEECL